MANEIIVMEQAADGLFELCFLYPIPSPIQINGSNVVVTPSAELPPIASAVMSAGEKTALDNGTAAFEPETFRRDPALTGGALLTKVQALYAQRKSEFDTRYAQRYEFAGDRFNAS